MPFVPFPTTVMAELLYTQDGQLMENTLYFDVGATPTQSNLEVLASELADWWDTNVRANVSNTVTLRAIRVTSLASDTSPVFELPVGLAGGGTSPAMPNNVTAAIKFLTGARGRSARGRNYLVGLMDEAVLGNTLHATTITNYLNAYDELRDGTVITTGTWVVASRFTNGAERTTGAVQEVTAVAFTDNIVDSQRRRLPGRGQ